jgi:DegV family protein with EDD domain
MANKVAIVTDSTALMPSHLVEQYAIRVAPQVLIWGDVSFNDGIDIQPEEFYSRLATDAVMPTTSQVPVGKMKQIFSDLADQGYDILAILISDKLSGTIASAVQAKELLPGVRVEIVNSYSVAMGMGFHVLAAARALEQGADLMECKVVAEQARDTTGIYLTVETLEFLHRGGRIGGGARFLGTALNIKPILEIRDGRVEALERIRTRKKALNRVTQLTLEAIGDRRPVRLATLHAKSPDEARAILDQAAQACDPVETFMSELSPVVGAHTGPGTIGIVYQAGM